MTVQSCSARVAAICAAMVLASCSETQSSGPWVTLRVTQDFGHEVLADERLPLEGHETPAKLLNENHTIRPDEYGALGSVDGLRQTVHSNNDPDQRTSWAVNVNGVEIDVPFTDFTLMADDVVQVDLGDLEATYASRATVGAFPKPFTGGLLGFLPDIEVECSEGYRRACTNVRRALREAGGDLSHGRPEQAPADPGLRRARFKQPVIRRAKILVGPWVRLRGRPWPRLLDLGPSHTGVYVRFSNGGESVQLLDVDETPVRRLGLGTGLVAAMCPSEADVLWLVTGTDRDGVELAAEAIDDDALRNALAVVTTPAGIEKLPLPRTETGGTQ